MGLAFPVEVNLSQVSRRVESRVDIAGNRIVFRLRADRNDRGNRRFFDCSFVPPIEYFVPSILYFVPSFLYFVPPFSYFVPPISFLHLILKS